jgi:hypothetical protein
MDGLMLNLRSLWRADRAILELSTRYLVRRSALTVGAAIIATFGLIMLEVSGYLALADILTPKWAAAAIGGANIVVATIVVAIAARVRPRRELEFATEMHHAAVQAMQTDARAAQARLAGLLALFRYPVSVALSGLALLLIRHIQSSKKAPE